MKRARIILLFTFFALLISSVSYANPVPYSSMDVSEYQAAKDIQIVDVRSPQSRERSGLEVKGEIWINPYTTKALEDFVANNDKTKAYAVYCSCTNDNYAIRTVQILTKRGFTNVKVLKNGTEMIAKEQLPLVKIKGDDQK